MAEQVTMPQLGESVVEATVGKWLVTEGQSVDKDTPLVELLTDKADAVVPSPIAGVVTKLLVGEDDTVEVGDVLCEVDANATATASAASAPAAPASSAAAGEPGASPSVRKLAREEGVDLSSVTPTGDKGRITQSDVRAAASSAVQATPSAPRPAPRPAPKAAPATSSPKRPKGAFRVPAYRPAPGDEVIPFSRRRRIIADHMVYSKATSPEVVTLAECDIHATAQLRNKHKGAFKKEGLGLSYLSFVVHATARALREFPDMNARVLDDAYVRLKNVNLGIAVDTPQGLVVPVIRDADELTIRGIVKAIDDLATRARTGDLRPDDLAAKTFSISNPGRKGNLVGGAIISQPNVGILRMGEIKKRVVVVENDGVDAMAIHPVMYMALTYDHRIVDGVNANGFLHRIGEILSTADFNVG